MRGPENLYVGVARLELHIPEARSLKAKRSATRRLVDRVRNKHQALVVESGHQDLHQRAAIAFCVLSTDPVDAGARLQRVRQTVDEVWTGMILDWEVRIEQV